MSEGRQTARRAWPRQRPHRPPLADDRADRHPPVADRVPHTPDLRTSAARRGLSVSGPPVRSDEPPAAPPPPPPRTRRRRVVAATALALVAVLVAAVVATRDEDDDPDGDTDAASADEQQQAEAPPPAQPTPPPREPTAPPPTAPDEEPPAEWQSDLLDLVHFVERERELAFAHPVRVDLLSDEDYVEAAGGQDGSLGFYDGQRVRVRGTELTQDVRGTLVHELTHALDDQHFGLFGGEGLPSQAMTAYMSLVEGDAVRMEAAYDLTLIDGGADPEDVLDEVHTGAGGPGAPAPAPAPSPPPAPGSTTTTVGSHGRDPGRGQTPQTPRTPQTPTAQTPADPSRPYGSEIPSLTDAIGQAPYFIGKAFIDVLVGVGGYARVDEAFRDPPTTTEQVLDPRAYLAHDEAVTVGEQTADLPKGDFDHQTSLGALNLYLVLAAGIGPVDALDAATGWGGETAFTYTDADCVELAVVGDTERDTAEIGDAFADWADSGLAAQASAAGRPDGAQVLTACGMGPGSTDPFDALVLAEARGAQTWAAMRDGGRDADAAFAFGICVVHAVSLDTLLTPVADGGLPAGAAAELEDAAAAC